MPRYTRPQSVADFARVGIRLDGNWEVEFQRGEDGVLVSVRRGREVVDARVLEPQRVRVLVEALRAMLEQAAMPAAGPEEGRFGLLETD